MMDGYGFCKKPVAKSKPVGPQGNGGEMGGQAVMAVSNPNGIEPKSHGSMKMPMAQGPVEPKVGK